VLAPHVDLFLCMSKPMDWKNVGDMLAWHETWMRSQPVGQFFGRPFPVLASSEEYRLI
jgi:hypothetical protein